jgi:phosphohistidine phosphatase
VTSTLVLDLLRHGDAAPAAGDGDARRPLTATGREALVRLGERLAAQGVRYDRALASPLRRALESAEAVLGAFPEPIRIEPLEALAPEAPPTRTLASLRQANVLTGHALLVGHQPLLGQLALLLSGAEARFAPGSLVRVALPPPLAAGTGRIVLALHPR